MPSEELQIVRLSGLSDYATAWALQRAVHRQVAAGERPDTLLLLEHPPTITMGRRGGWNHLVTPPEVLLERGFDLFQIDRGGDITYHGPGQLVGYPIVNLRRAELELGPFVRGLEVANIAVLAHYGISAAQAEGFTGVWCGLKKLTAIGVRVSKWTSMHGFALNVHTDLSHFEHIVACGLHGRSVGSIATLANTPLPSISEVERAIGHALASALNHHPVYQARAELPEPDLDEILEIRSTCCHPSATHALGS